MNNFKPLKIAEYRLPLDWHEDDPLFTEVCAFVRETRRASISAVQRKFKIGYNRAARLAEEMERTGVITPMKSDGSRAVIG